MFTRPFRVQSGDLFCVDAFLLEPIYFLLEPIYMQPQTAWRFVTARSQ